MSKLSEHAADSEEWKTSAQSINQSFADFIFGLPEWNHNDTEIKSNLYEK